MIKTLQRRFALSRQGAVDLIKGCIACVVQDISFMLPVGLLYYFVIDTMNGNLNGSRIAFYAVGSLVCLCSSITSSNTAESGDGSEKPELS